MADDKKTLKFQMMMTPAEAEQLDDWMFTNRVRSRAEAIRRLWQLALHQGSQIDKVKGLVDWGQGWVEEAVASYGKEHGLQIDLTEPLAEDAPAFLKHAKTAAGVASIASSMLEEMKTGVDLPEPGPLAFEQDAEKVLKRLSDKRKYSFRRIRKSGNPS